MPHGKWRWPLRRQSKRALQRPRCRSRHRPSMRPYRRCHPSFASASSSRARCAHGQVGRVRGQAHSAPDDSPRQIRAVCVRARQEPRLCNGYTYAEVGWLARSQITKDMSTVETAFLRCLKHETASSLPCAGEARRKFGSLAPLTTHFGLSSSCRVGFARARTVLQAACRSWET